MLVGLGATTFAYGQDGEQVSTAADMATARDLFHEGVTLAQQNKLEEAQMAYERSYALWPSNLTRYSIAAIQQRRGLLVEAQETLRLFIAADHDKTTQQYVPIARRVLASLEKRLAKVKFVFVEPVPDAKVFVDGQFVPPAAVGVYRSTNPGVRNIDIRAPGYESYSQQINLAAGEKKDVEVFLRPLGVSWKDSLCNGKPRRVKLSNATLLLISGGVLVTSGAVTAIAGSSAASSPNHSDKLTAIGTSTLGVGLLTSALGIYFAVRDAEQSPEEQRPGDKTRSRWNVRPWTGASGGGLVASGRF